MATTAFKSEPVNTVGDLPSVAASAPGFTLTGTDLADISLDSLAGQRVVLNIFPSVDTGVCAMSVRKFNELAAGLNNTTVVCASKDLPFALGRFCGAEGIENVTMLSMMRGREFLTNYGVDMTDGPLAGLAARAVVVLDEHDKVIHAQMVDDITHEPDYAAALRALG